MACSGVALATLIGSVTCWNSTMCLLMLLSASLLALSLPKKLPSC
jgi:predicted MFS family arabinose efflux permease